MAASPSARRSSSLCRTLALALLLVAPLFNAGVQAQEEDEVVTGPTPTVKVAESFVRGDMIPQTTAAPEPEGGQQEVILPTLSPQDLTTAAADDGQVPAEDAVTAEEVQTEAPKPETEPPAPPRGDGPINIPRPVPQYDVECVSKEVVQDKNAVSLKLKAPSSCEDTRRKIHSVIRELCEEDCKLKIHQEDNSDQILVSGKYVEDDVAKMANKFNNDNIKDKTDVEDAIPRWGKNSKLVLVSLLLAGLLLAALLVAGYYLKTHRKSSKGVRLADTFQVDEENQANTLVSVAPLPQEPLDKPVANGESPPENGNNPTPTTNGHSATQTPVADTEM